MLIVSYCFIQFLEATYPGESFTSTFKSQARDRFPLAAVYAPLNTVAELVSSAAASATAVLKEDPKDKEEANTAAATTSGEGAVPAEASGAAKT